MVTDVFLLSELKPPSVGPYSTIQVRNSDPGVSAVGM
jgi:hypothetical protein